MIAVNQFNNLKHLLIFNFAFKLLNISNKFKIATKTRSDFNPIFYRLFDRLLEFDYFHNRLLFLIIFIFVADQILLWITFENTNLNNTIINEIQFWNLEINYNEIILHRFLFIQTFWFSCNRSFTQVTPHPPPLLLLYP